MNKQPNEKTDYIPPRPSPGLYQIAVRGSVEGAMLECKSRDINGPVIKQIIGRGDDGLVIMLVRTTAEVLIVWSGESGDRLRWWAEED